MGLTAKGVEHAKSNGITRQEIPAGNGLYLVIQASGAKSFAVRYRVKGSPKSRKLTLDGFPSLHDARILAAEARKSAANGVDPAQAKQDAKREQMLANETTFASIANAYLNQLKIRSKDQARAKLNKLIIPEIGALPITEIGRNRITALLDDIENNNGAVQADRCLSAISQVFKYHERRTDTFRSPIVAGMRSGSTNQRDRVLTDDELRAVWNTGDPFCRFLLLTACRRKEASDLTWGELNGNDWLLPAVRHKAGTDLLRPLSQLAMDTLNAQPRRGAFVFGTNPHHAFRSFKRLKDRIDAASGVRNWTFHDLRRTSRTLMSRARIDSEIAERCLGHSVGNKIRKTYDCFAYKDEKAHGYETLARMIESIVSPPVAAGIPDIDAERKKRRRA
jgi:integrase